MKKKKKKAEPTYPMRGEVYWVKEPIASEADSDVIRKPRPAVIVSNDTGNAHSSVVEVVYLTTATKKPLPTHAIVEGIPGQESTVIAEQITTIPKERLGSFIRKLNPNELKAVNKALSVSVGVRGWHSDTELGAVLTNPGGVIECVPGIRDTVLQSVQEDNASPVAEVLEQLSENRMTATCSLLGGEEATYAFTCEGVLISTSNPDWGVTRTTFSYEKAASVLLTLGKWGRI